LAKNIIEFRNVTKRFPGVVANDNISFSIKEGEIFALLGENGAGKSTLMSMLFGLYQPDEGEIYVRGKLEHIDSPAKAASLDIGMVHQHFKLVSNYTVTENIILGIEPIKRNLGFLPAVDINKANAKIEELSKTYGLEVKPTSVIKNLKVSEQQRVEILKMLYRQAEILIFDEPTAVLTPQEIDYLLEIIRNLRDKGKTIILITHKLEEIKRVAERCAVLNRGRLMGILDVATTSTKEMARMMVGHDINWEIEKKPAKFGETVLRVSNLTVENEEKLKVVKNVSFEVHRGEIFAIAGVAGNGQVDLADAIAGLAKATEGTVTLLGKDITHAHVRERNTLGLSYVPEDRHNVGLILDFTLTDNLVMKNYFKPPFCKGSILQKQQCYAYANQLIERFDIRAANGGDTLVRSMSGGNQQKAIIAREISENSDFIMFVQPTRGLDIGAITAIREKMIEERDNGKAVLLISLDLDEIMSCADTIGVIYNGELLRIAEASKISKNEVGEYMMGVKTDG